MFEEFLKDPPKEIADKNAADEAKFTEVLKTYREEGSDVRENNNISNLLQRNFHSHPKVHRGYYDSRYAGVLYVIDCKTKEKIRKDESILLPSGEFTKKDSKQVWGTGLGNIGYEQKQLIFKALDGEPVAKEILEQINVHERDSGMYLPLKVELLHVILEPRKFSAILNGMYNGFCADTDQSEVPDSVEDLDFSALIPYIQNKVKHRMNGLFDFAFFSFTKTSSSYTIPKDSPFFPGYVIDDFDCFANLYQEYVRDGRKPAFYLNTSTNIQWNVNVLGGNKVVIEDHSSFGFNFILILSRSVALTENKPSQNNEGRLLSYSAKVEEYKIPFKLMEDEDAAFQRIENDFEVRYKAFKDKQNEFTKLGKTLQEAVPTIHPHDEPIYMGIELEVLPKDENRTDAGFSGIVSAIANSKMGDHCIMKSDSSIGDYGIEIVTIPATLDAHKQVFEEDFFDEPNAFHKRIMVDRRCGMHVHISKKCFTPLDFGKFSSFINSRENTRFIDEMSNRTANTYCQRDPLHGKNAKGMDISAKIARMVCNIKKEVQNGAIIEKITGLKFTYSSGINRRSAVNMQNAHTFEVRSFKCSNDKNNIFRKLEFCESLVRFVRKSSLQQMTVYDYVNFILDKSNNDSGALDPATNRRTHRYQYVLRWLAAKEYVGHDRKKDRDPKTGEEINKMRNIYSKNLIPNPHAPKPLRSYQKETTPCV